MSSNKRILMWCALILPVVVLAVNALGIMFERARTSPGARAADRTPTMPSATATPGVDDLAAEACLRAQSAVRGVLKAPSTAKFPDCGWSAHRYEIRATPDQRVWWVEGYVDSQNGFGAQIRTQFVVKLSRAGERWEVVNVAAE